MIRRTLLTAHRQAWCWQDEWVGLDLAAVRQLESETRVALARVMQEAAADHSASASASATGSSSHTTAPNAPHKSTSPKASPKKSAKESPKQSPKHKSSSGARGANVEADSQLHSQDTSNGAHT